MDLAERLRVWREAEAARAAVLKAALDAEGEDRGAYPGDDWADACGDASLLAD